MKPYHSTTRLSVPLMFTCEHSSARIPRKYGRLGLRKDQLERSKDLYDPGALELMLHLSKSFGASSLWANQSRLVLDVNRQIEGVSFQDRFHASALKHHVLVENEWGEDELVEIPSNSNKGLDEEEKRFKIFAEPYQNKGIEIASKLKARHEKVYCFQIHSFYPNYNGERRTIDIDVLYDHSKHLGHQFIDYLQKETSYKIGDNEPWAMKDVHGGALQVLNIDPLVDVVIFEVNNKHLVENPSAPEKFARLFERAIRSVLNFK